MPAFAKEFDVFVRALNEAAARQIAAAARAGATEIPNQQRARRGDAPGTISAVDGDQGKPFEAVKPDGQIILLFDYRPEIVHACFQELIARSPVVSGRYRSSFTCLLDGVGLQPLTVPSLEQLTNVQQIIIVNPVTYALRLESGINRHGLPFVRQVPPHIVEGAMHPVRREFSAAATLRYAVIDLAMAPERRRDAPASNRHKERIIGTPIQYPAIIIDR